MSRRGYGGHQAAGFHGYLAPAPRRLVGRKPRHQPDGAAPVGAEQEEGLAFRWPHGLDRDRPIPGFEPDGQPTLQGQSALGKTDPQALLSGDE